MKGQGSKPITSRLTSFDVEHGGYVETSYNFDREMEKFLGDIFDSYSQYHPFTLSDLTHVSGSPWDIVWSQAEHKAVPGMVYRLSEDAQNDLSSLLLFQRHLRRTGRAGGCGASDRRLRERWVISQK